MRRLAPFVLCAMLAVSGLCILTCLLQAADPHACCHDRNHGSPGVAVVQSHLPVVQHSPAPALPVHTAVAFSIPLAAPFEGASQVAVPVSRALPPLILRL